MILLNENTRCLVQGITGKQGRFHTEQMLKYNTNIVAGVTPGKGGQEVCGVPVFAGFKGGFAALVGPTGGFLVGFLLAALLYWLLEVILFRKLMTGPVKTWIFGALNSVIFEVVLYVTGVIWFMSVYAAQTGPVGLATVLGWCVIPFIIPDIVKLIAAVVTGERARKLIRQ